jgi:hypothetical protein
LNFSADRREREANEVYGECGEKKESREKRGSRERRVLLLQSSSLVRSVIGQISREHYTVSQSIIRENG